MDPTIKLLFNTKHVPTTTATSPILWLISTPFLPPHTIISTVQCLHSHPSDPLSPDPTQESTHLRSLLIRGLHVTGALIANQPGIAFGDIAKRAITATRQLRGALYGNNDGDVEGGGELVGGVWNCEGGGGGGGVRFFGSKGGELSVVEEGEGGRRVVWERGCLVRCGLDFKLPVFFNPTKNQDAVERYLHAHEGLVNMLKDPQLAFILESSKTSSDDLPHPIVVRGSELDFQTDLSNFKNLADTAKQSDGKSLCCSYFCSESRHLLPKIDAENADIIQVTVLVNKSEKSQQSVAPVAEYSPALEEATLRVVDYKLDVICYAVKDLPLSVAISKLIIPALVDQLMTMKNVISEAFLSQHPQLRPYHFCPPGLLHPVTAIYELSYGETEMKQVEARRSLHLRLGLPSDRPLLRIANALNFADSSHNERVSAKKGYKLLKDVHVGIPSSGVSGGLLSLVQGSYEYHHYLQNGFDDSGWGCAYRSLQTIISWFRLQQYTSVDIPTHREIQEALVEIGDKDPSFIGSREWIGAIELSYVLDKLLGVTCKVMNVRSGAELPEKCRELALHFENQGTPIMIGGGVLAYTLLGVDYNDASGDCAFLILDPHYTGNEDLKKIVNGGWCGWKKAVDSKGKNFFLADKFYNLLMPQRPNMV